jgi:sirohydrochlorin cobaltochelatase
LAAFGTAVPEARQAYADFEVEVRRCFPDIPVAWAYTAHKVRRKLASRGNEHDCVAKALSKMHDQGVTHLAVQSLHTVPGVEYFWTINLAKAYEHPRKGFQQVRLGVPLLHEDQDLERAQACLASYIPAERTPDEAVVLVGHGTYHHGQQRYLDFEKRIRETDQLLFIGLLMGEPDFASLAARLHQTSVSTVWLLPFMAVSGHHVRKDMFGEQDTSWKNQLRDAGFQVRQRIQGTIEYPCFRALWLEHLTKAMSGLHDNNP